MKITKLELKNFKRFDDLTIDLTSLPEPAKFVLLIGTNGSGKSSVFDAFEFLNKINRNEGLQLGPYYSKHQNNGGFEISAYTDQKDQSGAQIIAKYSLNKLNQITASHSFYGRTGVRQVPKLTRTNLGQGNVSFETDSDRPRTFVERDGRFENDIDKVASLILTDVFNGDTLTATIKESYINPINRAFENIFSVGDATRIRLISMKPPLEGKIAEILFEKGDSQIPYDYLSSGEKEIFNIILNLLVRKEYFQDTIYFLDEIDLHLNTQLQKSLLKEITENWIPDNCQLWTASHSLGFIDYANESEYAAIIDFDNLNFDVPQIIKPSAKNNFDVFEIAVSKDFLTTIFEGKRIIFSENKNTSAYNNLKIKDTIFLIGKDKADVFYKTRDTTTYNGLIDRDYLSDEERTGLMNWYQNLFILKYYSFENYLYHPDNLEEYYNSTRKNFDKINYLDALSREKSGNLNKILLKLSSARGSYPFYRENEAAKSLEAFKSNSESILDMLESSDFETFYKVFPAKDYGTEIKERQNINPANLAKTNWFKNKIEEVLTR